MLSASLLRAQAQPEVALLRLSPSSGPAAGNTTVALLADFVGRTLALVNDSSVRLTFATSRLTVMLYPTIFTHLLPVALVREMSRLGKLAVKIPDSVKVSIEPYAAGTRMECASVGDSSCHRGTEVWRRLSMDS